MSIQPFSMHIPQSILDDLHTRLERTRWPDEIDGSEWDLGSRLGYMQDIVEYWQDRFDWRHQEEQLNRFAQFRTEIDGFGIHFLHERGKGPQPLPLVMTHGWPGSFYEMHKILPLLTDPAQYGGDAADAFDVIVPSLPGFGFSDRPRQPGMSSTSTAKLWMQLMINELGYPRFGASGGDIGAGVTQRLALQYPEFLIGIHLHYFGTRQVPPDSSPAEQEYVEKMQQWDAQEGAYAYMHRTKPQTLAYGLNDSPVGLAAWIIEKFRSWSDCDGNIERRFSKDELLTNVMIYWVTQTIRSSTNMYYENSREAMKQPLGQYLDVPAGYAQFPKEIAHPPRELVERTLRLTRWTLMPRGGHFAELEEPQLLAEDIRAFFRPLR